MLIHFTSLIDDWLSVYGRELSEVLVFDGSVEEYSIEFLANQVETEFVGILVMQRILLLIVVSWFEVVWKFNWNIWSLRSKLQNDKQKARRSWNLMISEELLDY